jgi:acyl dehydratase
VSALPAGVAVGDELGELAVEVTAGVIIGAALASRDFEPVHHDRDAAQASGLPDIFLNILATNGFVVRYVTDWAGPEAIVQRSDIRLGVPHVAGETLRLTGTVTRRDGAIVDVAVRGRNTTGDHVTGTVTVDLGAGA